jgi:hypothetical protein
MAFPPWHPLSAAESTTETSVSHHVEMGSVLQQLNILKGLCSTSVSGYAQVQVLRLSGA